MANTDQYVALITSQHRDLVLFPQAVAALCEGFADGTDLLIALPDDFDLDTAVGAQLDAVGEWIGITRQLVLPYVNYFSWDDPSQGWDTGRWRGPFDPTSAVIQLNDADYRDLLYAKIAANRWDGTKPMALEILQDLFPGTTPFIQDCQNMTIIMGFLGDPPSAEAKAIVGGNLLDLKPSGVRMLFAEVPASGPMFAWGVNTADLAGWGTGQWAAIT